MKTTEEIRTFEGKLLGTIETFDNGDQVARGWPAMKILGFYRKRYNHTTDFYGKVVSQGNTVVSFIYSNK